MRWLLLIVLAFVFPIVAHAAHHEQPDTHHLSGWEQYLSSQEKIMPLARESTGTGSEWGLDGLTGQIDQDIRDIQSDRVPPEELNLRLALIWVYSVQAAMWQAIDPYPNPAYEEIINKGMQFAGERLGIPNYRECMLMTAQALNYAAQEANPK